MELHNPYQGGFKDMPDGDSLLRNHRPMKPRHELRHLFIYKNQVMLDVSSQIDMLLTSRRKEMGIEANAAADMLDRYKAQFDRWIDKHVEKVKERLIISVVDVYATASGDELKDWAEKEILLQMPDWWDDTAWRPLVDTVHDYMVNAVMSEYLKIILTVKDPVTISKMEDADDAYEKIKVHLCKHRQGAIKRNLKPLGF